MEEESSTSSNQISRKYKQDVAYKESVLPKAVTKRVAVEMGASFGASAPAPTVLAEYGFTTENVVNMFNKL